MGLFVLVVMLMFVWDVVCGGEMLIVGILSCLVGWIVILFWSLIEFVGIFSGFKL